MDKKTEPKYTLRLIFYSERARKILYGVSEFKATTEKESKKNSLLRASEAILEKF